MDLFGYGEGLGGNVPETVTMEERNSWLSGIVGDGLQLDDVFHVAGPHHSDGIPARVYGVISFCSDRWPLHSMPGPSLQNEGNPETLQRSLRQLG